MCGIAGVFGSSLAPDELRAALERMALAMLHRGPDQGAVELFPELEAGLAVRRLSFVDLEGGSQPIANEDGTVVALLNGEIYNHGALRRELVVRGHRFRTRCDTEVLVHLYEEAGDAALGRLEGMFAVAIVDRARRRLLLARDGPGMKPLYVARAGGALAFASEVKALFASGLVEPRPDPAGIDVFLASGFVPAPRTAFAGIEKLAAGERMVVDASGVRRDRFWSFRYRTDAPPLSDVEYVDELERRLTSAVDTHLAADVPIGCFLSGGWDSSIVATLAARRLGSRLATFSLVFPDDPDADERRHSRRMASAIGSEHREVEYRAAMLPGLLARTARALDEPVAASPVVLMTVLASLAGAHVRGVVGGEGADELFGGYDWLRSPWPYRLRLVTPSAIGRWGALRAPDPRVRRWMRIAAAPSLRAADAEWTRFLLPVEKRALLRPELWSDGPDTAAIQIGDELAATCVDDLQRRLAHDLRGRLAESILLKHDKLAMAESLEVRLPFLDRGVVELAARMPSRLKMHRGREKVVVRELARRLLPPEIAARRKKGLGYPRGAWSRPPIGDYVRELLLDGADTGPFRRPALERFLGRRSRLLADDRPLIALAALQAWWNEFLAPGAVARAAGRA